MTTLRVTRSAATFAIFDPINEVLATGERTALFRGSPLGAFKNRKAALAAIYMRHALAVARCEGGG